MRIRRGVVVIAGLSLVTMAPREAVSCNAVLMPISEVVGQSEVILRAKAVSAREQPKASGGDNVELRILEVIKGTFKLDSITVPGHFSDYRELRDRKVPYQQLNCSRAAGCGGCFAYEYKKGKQYLLILKEGTPYWAPLSPTNEDVYGENDRWITWIKSELRRLTNR